MADKKYTFVVDINEQSARSQARTLRTVFERELGNLQIVPQVSNTSGLKQVETAIQAQAKAFQDSTKKSSRASIDAERQSTTFAKASAAERINASRAESAERINAARAAATAAMEQERRLTATTRAEIREREFAQRQAQRSSGAGGQPGQGAPAAGIGGLAGRAIGAATGALAAYVSVQGVRQIADFAAGWASADTNVRRTAKAFELLAGGAQNAEGRLLALQNASNRTISRLEAMNLANTAAALKLANTAAEFEELGRAARIITLVSPVITDVNDALTQLALFAANATSFARADQLGLNAGEVRNRMAELRAETASLTAEDAKLAASLELIDANFGFLLDTTEAQASGLERLKVAWNELLDQPSWISSKFNDGFGAMADTFNQLMTVSGMGTSASIFDAARTNLEAAENQAKSAESLFGSLLNPNADVTLALFQETFDALNRVNQAIQDGVPGALEYRNQIEEIVIQQSRFGIGTTEQAEKLQEINQYLSIATSNWKRYNAEQSEAESIEFAEQQVKEFVDSLGEINEAISSLSGFSGPELPSFGEMIDELESLRNELVTTGTLSDDQKYRLDELTAAAGSSANAIDILAATQERFGSSLFNSDEQITSIANQIVELNSALAAGRISQDAYAAGLESLNAAMASATATAQGEFNAALGQSLEALQTLDTLSGSGFPGIEALRQQLVAVRTDIIANGAATSQQVQEIERLTAAVNAASSSQIFYGDIIASLGPSFLQTNERAAEIVAQINEVDAALATGSIGAAQYAQAIFQLRAELEGIASGVELQSTDSIGDLAGAILTLDSVTAGGLSGFDTLLDQAFELESQIISTGIVTAQQAADIEYLALVADTAAGTTGYLTQVQNALGVEFLQNNEHAAGLMGQIIQLIAAHANGTISSEVFAGALNILTGQLVATGEQAGLTAAQINAAFGALQQFNAEQSAVYAGTPGYERGSNVGATIAASQEAAERARQRALAEAEARERKREAERLAKEQERLQKQAAREAERAFEKAAQEAQRAFEEAAQEFESQLQNVPGLLGGRSSVTQQQLDRADAGLPQNFADDFLRRLEDEINQGKDIYPDVSIEQAREALERIGITAAEDAEIMFGQLVEAWESGALFADKANLDLINAEAVRASIELQELAKQGQQNIIDHFKEVIGFSVDAATGNEIDGLGAVSGGGGGLIPITSPSKIEIPESVDLEAPGDLSEQLATGTVSVSAVTVSPEAFATIDALLSERISTLVISQVNFADSVFSTIDTLLTERLFTVSVGASVVSGNAFGAVDTFLTERLFTISVGAVAVNEGVYSTIDTALTERITTLGIDSVVLTDAAYTSVDTALSERVSTLVISRVTFAETAFNVIDTALTEKIAVANVGAATIAPGAFGAVDTFLAERLFSVTIGGVTIMPTAFDALDTFLVERLFTVAVGAISINDSIYGSIDTALTERLTTLPIDSVQMTETAFTAIDTALTERISSLVISRVSFAEGAFAVIDTALTEKIAVANVGASTIAPGAFGAVDTFLAERLFSATIGGSTVTPTAFDTLGTYLTERLFTATIGSAVATETAFSSIDTLLTERLLTASVGDVVLTETALTGVDTFLTERLFTATIGKIELSPTATSGFEASLTVEQLAGPARIGLQLAQAVETGYASYAFPNVGIVFVSAFAAQTPLQAVALGGQGYALASMVNAGFSSFDFGLALYSLVRSLRTGIQKDEIREVLHGVGVEAANIVGGGLEEGAGTIGWATILAESIKASVLEELGEALE